MSYNHASSSTDSSNFSSPVMSRENSYIEDKDGVTLPARGGGASSAAPAAALSSGASKSTTTFDHLTPSEGGGENDRIDSNINSKKDWLSPPASPHPETTPFFDESEAKRSHMVRLCRSLAVYIGVS